ncbi:MAG TPA: PASTA domain-containing protein [Bacteroidota bacterium]|nr:PASTA domain-containing protein [Bacteroidota bacterium]
MPLSKSHIKTALTYAAIAFAALLVLLLLIDNVVMPRYVQQGRTTKVPQVLGMRVEDAKKLLLDMGLNPKETEPKQDKEYPIGTVAFQNPPPDAIVKYGRGVYLTVSGGELLVEVPSLRGKSIRDATFDLEKSSLKLGSIQYLPSDEFFENTVISQEVEPGRKVKSGTVISVFVSQGRNTNRKAVPKVLMKTLEEAEKILAQEGFKVGSITYQPSLDLLPNTVMEQYPKAGELGTIGQPVDLFVAQRAEPKKNVEY